MMLQYHIPVMAAQSIEGLNIRPADYVVDATFGGGGHSKLILEKLTTGKLIAFDQDTDATVNLPNHTQFVFIRHNFRYLKNFLYHLNIMQVDSILADLGVSSHDFDVPERGFSHRFDGHLDMRMNQNAKTDAFTIVNTYSEEKLVSIFKNYGEVFNASRLVSEICKKRKVNPIRTTSELKEIASSCTPKAIENKYLAQVFQALRIEVNDEMEALREFLSASVEMLRPGGRLVILTYHSLEDRLCKNFMRSGNFEGEVEKDFYGNVITPFKLITRKAVTPDKDEIKLNGRSKSAKLRIAEKN